MYISLEEKRSSGIKGPSVYQYGSTPPGKSDKSRSPEPSPAKRFVSKQSIVQV